MNTELPRRTFLKSASIAALGFGGLKQFVHGQNVTAQSHVTPFGDLVRDRAGIFDLPKGFTRKVISTEGRFMADGFVTPGKFDGMAAFPTPDGKTVIIRNHELTAQWKHLSPFQRYGNKPIPLKPEQFYDFGNGTLPPIGGTTNLVYNTQTQEVESEFLSLIGTERNCAGGPTPWGTWITCEETTVSATPSPSSSTRSSRNQRHHAPTILASSNQPVYMKDHGYNFEVRPFTSPQLSEPIPLKAMGRFKHEAIAVHPNEQIIYQTEDVGDGLIYRFLLNDKSNPHAGGRLQALAFTNHPGADTRDWGLKPSPLTIGQPLPVKWVDLDEVESPKDDLRYRGLADGAAVFARGEGIITAENDIYWCCTNGGAQQLGQVFRYIPSPFEGTEKENTAPATLQLFVESNSPDQLENCDNCCIAPWGDLIIAEDHVDIFRALNPVRLIGITPQGQSYVLAQNRFNGSELCGPCFSPDGSTLFINIQSPGITLAITGPWEQLRSQV